MIFITSDHHFGHDKIIEYEQRPFSSLDSMTNVLINRWNERVNDNDVIWHLGDFSFYNKHATREILDRLNGRKNLIMGNHDRHRTMSWWHDVGFLNVIDGGVVLEDFWLLRHEPVVYKNSIQTIHGHIHKTKESAMRDHPQCFNVSVDVTDFAPVSFDDVKKEFLGRQ